MSLRSKRTILFLIAVIAAVAIVVGMWFCNKKIEYDNKLNEIKIDLNDNYQIEPTTSELVTEAIADDFEPTTVELSTEELSGQNVTETSEETIWDDYESLNDNNQIQENQEFENYYKDLKNKSSKYRLYYVLFVLLGIVLDILLILLLLKEKILFSFELSVGVALVIAYELMNFTFGSVLEEIVLFIAITVLPYAVHNILKWILHRCTLDDCVPHRLGYFITQNNEKPHMYIMVSTIWMLICVIVAITSYVFYSFGLINQNVMVAGIITFLVFAVIAFLTIAKFSSQLSHLEEQLDRIHKGELIEAEDGAFCEIENKLALLKEEREIAIANALKSERFKVDLITNVSHDLRTPLTSILGNGELLKEEEMSEVGRKRLEALNVKTEYMIDLVDRLFELTKVSSGVIEPKREDIDLIKLIEQTIGLYEEKLNSGRLTVKRHFYQDTVMLNTDGAMLHQIVSNLLGNAIKYSPCDSRIHIRVEAIADNRIQIRISNVSAYEMDFTAEEIVQRFARGDKARSTSGSGIGLAIVKTYADALEADFHIDIDDEQFIATVEI